MRELLCVPQSSKERLRRSRTESSGATPAIEELAGEARQVRPAGPRADQYQPGSDFSRAGRSGGRPALRLPRATFSHRRSACRPIPTIHSRSRKFPLRYRSRPFEEVWRAPGPPAPTSIKLARKFEYPPPSRPHPAEVGNCRSGIVHAHSRLTSNISFLSRDVFFSSRS